MRLSDREFRAMNNPLRRFVQRRVEFPIFRRMGLDAGGKDVLEIGCGSGYGAVLLSSLRPKSYVGIDLDRRKRRHLFGYYRAVAC